MKIPISVCIALLMSWTVRAENLDSNLPRASTHELEMTAGRLNKVPVSGAWYGQFTFTSGPLVTGYLVDLRVQCVAGDQAAADECDPGLLVVATGADGQVRNVAYNNDHPNAGGNGLGSFLSLGQGRSQTVTYKVVVYSHHRGTSRVNIRWAWHAADVLTDWATVRPFVDPVNPARQLTGLNQVVGGVLVKLGPVNASDRFNVRTVDDGVAAGTRMWLFNPTRRAFAFVDGPVSGDLDPDFRFSSTWMCDATCAARREASNTFAIIGKDDTQSGLEVWVDLVKSISANESFVSFPFGLCWGSPNRPDCLSTSDTTLSPGVYFFSVFATTSHAVGGVSAVDGGAHPGSETGNEVCSNASLSQLGLFSMNRGQGNDLALTLELVEDGRVIRTRHVPRGALGAKSAARTEWNRLTLEHTVPDDGVAYSYRINLRQVAPMVTVNSRWSFRRNPESVELKVATLNMEYGDNMQQRGEVQNAADLLGAGPNYLGSEVVYRANRGQWRWEADILNFNELMSGRGAWMQDRLNARTRLPWLRSEGESIWPNNNPWGTTRYGPSS